MLRAVSMPIRWGIFGGRRAALKRRRGFRPLYGRAAAFCLWGGCFILATVIAEQIFHFHGELTAAALVTVAAGMAWLLPPKTKTAGSNGENRGAGG